MLRMACIVALISVATYTNQDDVVVCFDQPLYFSTPAVWRTAQSKLMQLRLFHLLIIGTFGLVFWFVNERRWIQDLWRWLNVERAANHADEPPPGARQTPNNERLASTSLWSGILHVHRRYLYLVLYIASRTIPLVLLFRACLLAFSPPTKGLDSEGQSVHIIYDRAASERYGRALSAALQLLADMGSFSYGFFLTVLTVAMDSWLCLFGTVAFAVGRLLQLLQLSHSTWITLLYSSILAHPARSLSLANKSLAHAIESNSKSSIFTGVAMHPYMYYGVPMPSHFLDDPFDDMYDFGMYGFPGGAFEIPVRHRGFPGPAFTDHLIDEQTIVDTNQSSNDNESFWKTEFFSAVVVAPIVEEAIFRYAFFKLWDLLTSQKSTQARDQPQLGENLWYGYHPCALVSSLLFAACHLNNHIARSSDVPYMIPPIVHDGAFALATRAVIQFLITFFLSTHTLTTLFMQRGIWASVGAHAFWNLSCFGMAGNLTVRVLCRVGIGFGLFQALRRRDEAPRPAHQEREQISPLEQNIHNDARLARLRRFGGLGGDRVADEDRNGGIEAVGFEAGNPRDPCPDVKRVQVWPQVARVGCWSLSLAVVADLAISKAGMFITGASWPGADDDVSTSM